MADKQGYLYYTKEEIDEFLGGNIDGPDSTGWRKIPIGNNLVLWALLNYRVERTYAGNGWGSFAVPGPSNRTNPGTVIASSGNGKANDNAISHSCVTWSSGQIDVGWANHYGASVTSASYISGWLLEVVNND